MEDFAQTNMFAWICIVFAHLIIGCAIRYSIIAKYTTCIHVGIYLSTVATCMGVDVCT